MTRMKGSVFHGKMYLIKVPPTKKPQGSHLMRGALVVLMFRKPAHSRRIISRQRSLTKRHVGVGVQVCVRRIMVRLYFQLELGQQVQNSINANRTLNDCRN